MCNWYFHKDGDSFGYKSFRIGNDMFRGVDCDPADAITYLGSAHTFGRLCHRPFPEIVGNLLGVATQNLGSGGKGPQYYSENPELLHRINSSKAVVIQMMSGRSVSNCRFRSINGNQGWWTVNDTRVKSTDLFDLYARANKQVWEQMVHTSRIEYWNQMVKLFASVKVPTLLLWWSTRKPYQLPPISKYHLGDFPHLIDQQLWDRLVTQADASLMCTSVAGMPHLGQSYYPSPEMHEEVASKVALHLRALST